MTADNIDNVDTIITADGVRRVSVRKVITFVTFRCTFLADRRPTTSNYGSGRLLRQASARVGGRPAPRALPSRSFGAWIKVHHIRIMDCSSPLLMIFMRIRAHRGSCSERLVCSGFAPCCSSNEPNEGARCVCGSGPTPRGDGSASSDRCHRRRRRRQTSINYVFN